MSRGIDGYMRTLGKANLPVSRVETDKCSCGEYLEFGTDAIGRTTERCPRCDGVAKRRKPNPNEALVPQGLVPAYRSLPPATPGEPCAHCGHVVPGPGRTRKPMPLRPETRCLGCGDVVDRGHGGRPSSWCDKPACEAKAPARIRCGRKFRRAKRAAKGGA